jgi:subtilisin family serine protease
MKKNMAILLSLLLVFLTLPAWAKESNKHKIDQAFLQELVNSKLPTPVIVELKDDPVSLYLIRYKMQQERLGLTLDLDEEQSIAEQYRIQLNQKQKSILESIKKRDQKIVFSNDFTEVINGFALRVPGDSLFALSLHPSLAYINDVRLEFSSFRRQASASTGVNSVWNGSADIKASGKKILVGVIDSGIDAQHPEFKDKIKGGLDLSGEGNFGIDANFHGTHVAGIAVGSGQNNTSRGMAYDANLMVYKVNSSKQQGIPSENIYKAIDQSVKDKCQVINLSLGHVGSGEVAQGGTLMHRTVKNASNAGVFVVAAIGNSGSRSKNLPWVAGAPAITEEAFSVAASNDREGNTPKISSFTSMGITPDAFFKPEISAPGVDIHSTLPKRYGSYAGMSGTSMASPVITGIVALIKEARPQWTNSQIKSSLMNTADLIINSASAFPVTFTLQGAGQANIVKALNTPAFIEPRALVIENWEKGYQRQISFQANTDATYPVNIEVFVDKDEVMPFKLNLDSTSIQLKKGQKATLDLKILVNETLPNTFIRARYEGIIRIGSLHIPFLLYKETVEKENSLAIQQGVSDIQISKLQFVQSPQLSPDPMKIVFSLNTGSEQKFEDQTSNSNFGTVRVFLSDKYGMDWSRRPIYELNSVPAGYYSFNWDGLIEGEEHIPNGEYALRFETTAKQDDQAFSSNFFYSDDSSFVYSEPVLASQKMAISGEQVELTLYWDFFDQEVEQLEINLNIDDRKMLDLQVELHDFPFAAKNPIIRKTSMKLEWEGKWNEEMKNQRYKLASLRFTTKGIGKVPWTARCSIKNSSKKITRVYPFLPDLTLTRRSFLLGDLNGDAKVNFMDLYLISRYMDQRVDLSNPQQVLCDLNQDRWVNDDDIALFFKEYGQSLE